jgi:hypothetical protein
MSNETQSVDMSDEEFGAPGAKQFGNVYSQQKLLSLDHDADRDRGFLTENDRRYLTRQNLTGQPERRARMRIRNRVLSAYFDTRYFEYISDEDRRQIFEKARKDFDLHFREAVKEFIRFTHRGLDEFNVDTAELIEHGLREAEHDRAIADGEYVNVQVDVKIEREQGPDIEELQERFENHEWMPRGELAALVNNRYTEIDLVDALNHQARQLDDEPQPPDYKAFDMGSGASQYSWEDPDADEADEILSWLRSFFDEHDIETFDEYDIAYDRLREVDEKAADELSKKVQRLSRCAPQFEEQLAEEADLPTTDMALLHDILWNPEDIDVREALEREARPRTAGEDWSPSEDVNLQKFIARVKVAREMGRLFTSGGEEGHTRWQRLLDVVEFDEEEWSDYIQERRVEAAKDVIREVFSEADDRDFGPSDNRNPDGTLTEEFIEKVQQDTDLDREEIEEEFGVYPPIENPPGRSDLDDIRTADEFHETFDRTHDTAEITFLESKVGEEALSQAFEELSKEWQDTE